MKTLTVEFDFHKDWTITGFVPVSDKLARKVVSAFKEFLAEDDIAFEDAGEELWEDFFYDTDLDEIDGDGSAVVFNRIAREAQSLASELLDDPVNYEWDYRCVSLQ